MVAEVEAGGAPAGGRVGAAAGDQHPDFGAGADIRVEGLARNACARAGSAGPEPRTISEGVREWRGGAGVRARRRGQRDFSAGPLERDVVVRGNVNEAARGAG